MSQSVDEHNDRAAAFWNREVTVPTHVSWFSSSAVRDFVNRRITGSSAEWPMDGLQRWLAGRRFRTALSVGCGTGPLERDLIKRDICDEIDAFDGSEESLRIARSEAGEAGARITYYQGDFNAPKLRRASYDAVFFHQSMHHVANLERLLRTVMDALTPGGILYIDEYVGPSRTQWNDSSIRLQRAAYAMLPDRERTSDSLALPIQDDDPSEAIRSGEIMDQIRIGFDIVEQRDYGGNLLSVLFPHLRHDGDETTVSDLIRAEEALLAGGERSFHTVLIATPRAGFRRWVARLRYIVEPPMKLVYGKCRRRLLRLTQGRA